MSSFEFMLSHIGGKKQTQNEMLAHCAQCGKKKLYWNILPPHVFYCQACSYKGNSISLGYRSKVKKTNLTDVQKAVYRYHRLTKKNHRLSEKVLNHFKLKLKKYSTLHGREYHALTLFTAKGQAIKRLISRSWIALNKADMPNEYWLNVHNLDRKKRRVYVTAGEWDLFSFWENTGINAISPCYGENPRKWKDHTEDLELFQNKEVIILYDNDTKGRQGGLSLAKGIARFVKNKGIRLIDLSVLGSSPGEDLDDFFSEGGTKQRLLEVINQTAFFNQKIDMNQMDLDSLRERNIQCPLHRDSMFSKQIISTLWKIAGYPTAMKESLLLQLAEPDNDEKEIRRSIKAYNQEIIVLSWLAIKSEIKRSLAEFRVINKETVSKEDDPISYFYQNGVYETFSMQKKKNTNGKHRR